MHSDSAIAYGIILSSYCALKLVGVGLEAQLALVDGTLHIIQKAPGFAIRNLSLELYTAVYSNFMFSLNYIENNAPLARRHSAKFSWIKAQFVTCSAIDRVSYGIMLRAVKLLRCGSAASAAQASGDIERERLAGVIMFLESLFLCGISLAIRSFTAQHVLKAVPFQRFSICQSFDCRNFGKFK